MLRMNTEILAPAGSFESLEAAVRCGANAVYLGGKTLNARRGAANFSAEELDRAISYCHARGVKVYLTLNTLVYDAELPRLLKEIEAACDAGADALIVQDLAAAKLARECAPEMPLHASTQMSVHNAAGAAVLKELGFSRVVLARELSQKEIAGIAKNADIELECFVHGALCMCVSGQCTLSAMIGGRSGNRGLCAQPCRLKFSSPTKEYALSLKDLSLIPQIFSLADAGVSCLKIEGRMKRPEYVAAAVTACKQALAGNVPDMETLAAVFSRSGFTDGYFTGQRGGAMFGVRQKEDVAAATAPLLSRLSALYREERPCVPARFAFAMRQNEPAVLRAVDADGNTGEAHGETPQQALTAPTTEEKAASAFSKTGGTIFTVSGFDAAIEDGLMLPASALNALRRTVLDELLRAREAVKPVAFASKPDLLHFTEYQPKTPPEIRVRVENPCQLTENLAQNAGLLIVPATEISRLDAGFLRKYAEKLAVELPRVLFNKQDKLYQIIQNAKQHGIVHAVAGNLYAVKTAKECGLAVHGDFSLNITNSLALAEYARIGLRDATVSFELSRARIAALGGSLPRGILAYGHLPLMVMRNCPIGDCKICKKDGACLTDRLGNRFPVRCGWGTAEILNCVPLFLADRLQEFNGVDFFTLYFTSETPAQCGEIFELYRTGGRSEKEKTRGLYYREVP